jgi:hypothetical protein
MRRGSEAIRHPPCFAFLATRFTERGEPGGGSWKQSDSLARAEGGEGRIEEDVWKFPSMSIRTW